MGEVHFGGNGELFPGVVYGLRLNMTSKRGLEISE